MGFVKIIVADKNRDKRDFRRYLNLTLIVLSPVRFPLSSTTSKTSIQLNLSGFEHSPTEKNANPFGKTLQIFQTLSWPISRLDSSNVERIVSVECVVWKLCRKLPYLCLKRWCLLFTKKREIMEGVESENVVKFLRNQADLEMIDKRMQNRPGGQKTRERRVLISCLSVT